MEDSPGGFSPSAFIAFFILVSNCGMKKGECEEESEE